MTKKLIGFVVLLAACHRGGSPTPLPPTVQLGADTPAHAVDAFLLASRAGDLQAMSAVWGTDQGTVRNQLPRTVVEERETYIITCTKNDRYQVLSEGPAAQGQRVLAVQLTRGAITRPTTITTVQGPGARWFVKDAQLKGLEDICKAK